MVQPYLHYNFSKGIDEWLDKHNRYSHLEAQQAAYQSHGSFVELLSESVFGDGVRRRRALKRLSYRVPFRPTAIMLYQLVFRFGFMDGAAGLNYIRLRSIYEAMTAVKLAVLRQQGFKLAVIDTPPAITMAIQSVISVAELIVVPTRPSPHDLRAVGATVDLCERAGKPLVFVVNAATPKAKITSEAAVALSQHGTVAPITLHHRTDFAASMIDGRTVMEVDPESRSAAEIAALWRYIADRLEKNFRRTVFAPAPKGAVQQMGGVPRPAGGFGRRVAQ
jgi:chromosome partitioning protein